MHTYIPRHIYTKPVIFTSNQRSCGRSASVTVNTLVELGFPCISTLSLYLIWSLFCQDVPLWCAVVSYLCRGVCLCVFCGIVNGTRRGILRKCLLSVGAGTDAGASTDAAAGVVSGKWSH